MLNNIKVAKICLNKIKMLNLKKLSRICTWNKMLYWKRCIRLLYKKREMYVFYKKEVENSSRIIDLRTELLE